MLLGPIAHGLEVSSWGTVGNSPKMLKCAVLSRAQPLVPSHYHANRGWARDNAVLVNEGIQKTPSRTVYSAVSVSPGAEFSRQ